MRNERHKAQLAHLLNQNIRKKSEHSEFRVENQSRESSLSDVNVCLCAIACQSEMVIKKTIAMEKTGAISKQVVHKIIIMKIEKYETKKESNLRHVYCEYGRTLLFVHT